MKSIQWTVISDLECSEDEHFIDGSESEGSRCSTPYLLVEKMIRKKPKVRGTGINGWLLAEIDALAIKILRPGYIV